jgi:hypothetical protein
MIKNQCGWSLSVKPARATSLGFHDPKLTSVWVAQEHHGLGATFKFLPQSALGITTSA